MIVTVTVVALIARAVALFRGLGENADVRAQLQLADPYEESENDRDLADCTNDSIWLDDRQWPLRVLSFSETNDLALLELMLGDPPGLAVLRGAGREQLGESVTVVGFPLGDVLGQSLGVARGVVSGERGQRNAKREFRFRAAIQFGSSGSPVIDDNGLVIGVVTRMLSRDFLLEEKNDVLQVANFAVKGSLLGAFLETMEDYETTPHPANTDRPALAQIVERARRYTHPVHCWALD